jgi:hypothetical protein
MALTRLSDLDIRPIVPSDLKLPQNLEFHDGVSPYLFDRDRFFPAATTVKWHADFS